MHARTSRILPVLLFAALNGCATTDRSATGEPPYLAQNAHKLEPKGRRISSDTIYESAGQKFRVETVGKYDDVIWGFDFLPDHRIVFTTRDEGKVGIMNPLNGVVMLLTGVPEVEYPAQGGMLDVRVLPRGGGAPVIYLTYTAKIPPSNVGTFLGSGALVGNTLSGFHKLFSVKEGVRSGNQFGSRIEFDGAGHVFITTGDHGKRDLAQSLDSHIGKVLRLNLDGTMPQDNPFVGSGLGEIWALGLRSPQGLARHPVTGELWEAEMGPRGGDELNIIKRGANYGWPKVCWGLEYSGEPVGEGRHELPGMENPVAYWLWTPEKHNLTPSALMFYTGDKFPAWKGNAFLGTLSTTHLQRLVLDGRRVVEQEELLGDLGLRIRNVRQGPDGLLYFSTDSGLLAKLVPVR